ncbi:toll-like receptor 6 [Anabrus simplex]|uniref:toll-like receptor 6 n=1 Tax=Anabrus simplex TaxID=316456 RepID=UPI0035A3B865
MEFIPDDMWKHLESVKVLDLGMNHFLCCHDNFTVLQHRLNTSLEIVRNLNTTGPLDCFPDTQSARVLLPTFKDRDTLCFIEIISVTLLVAAPLGALSFIIIFFTAYIYYYRFEFNYIRFLLNKKESEQIKDDVEAIGCVYDAFVCFSQNNYAWVAGQLLPNLEKEPYRYRLCLHTRDFTLGAAIDKNVTEALKKSRKFICVLTKPFLKSKWCQWELSKAIYKMFTEGRDYIILIELEQFERTNLPTDLEYLMDSRTYLKWPLDTKNQRGIERCWQRLRHALGDSLVKRTGKEGPEGSVLDL